METRCSTDAVKVCAEKLKTEFQEFSFGVLDTYGDAHNIELSLKEYEMNRPEGWTVFLIHCFPIIKVTAHEKEL